MMDLETLKTYFSYDPETGMFTRIKTVRGSKVGPVGSLDKLGYVIVPFRRKRYLAHRLAWLYVHGEWPKSFIDHINGARYDNRITNLREATNAENHHNLKGPSKGNKSGFLGVSKRSDREKWTWLRFSSWGGAHKTYTCEQADTKLPKAERHGQQTSVAEQ